ncbi:MAG: hypothetical protein GY913_28330 [Proteobacteria bacterium]|nr:hypothetical protein [Pseudomonadota bacterium]MCP4920820.1 hypothetical protein [Pseudomonadota bacterium]
MLLSLCALAWAVEPAPAAVGHVLIEGEVRKVELLGAEGEFEPPGEVPAGRYLVLATWADGRPFVAGRLTVGAGQAITLRCDASFAICLPVSAPEEGWEGAQMCPEGPSTVRVEGDASTIVFVRGERSHGPGEVPPGTWRIWAAWQHDGKPELTGLVEVRSGEEVTVRCSEAFAVCKATEARCASEAAPQP